MRSIKPIYMVSFIYLVLAFHILAQKEKSTKEANSNKIVTDTKATLKTTNPAESPKNENENEKESPKLEDEFEVLLKKELEGGVDEPKVANKGEISWGWQIMKTFLALFFLIGVFWFAWRIYTFKKELPSQESKVMKTLYRHELSNGKQVHIVEFSENLLLLGVSDSGIHLISEVSDRNQINQIKLDCERENLEEKPDFLWELTKKIKERFSDWSFPQKNILSERMSGADNQIWNELRENSRIKLQNLKEQKDFFNKG